MVVSFDGVQDPNVSYKFYVMNVYAGLRLH